MALEGSMTVLVTCCPWHAGILCGQGETGCGQGVTFKLLIFSLILKGLKRYYMFWYNFSTRINFRSFTVIGSIFLQRMYL